MRDAVHVLLSAALCLLSLSCSGSEVTPTQAVVFVSAEGSLVQQAAKVRLSSRGGTGTVTEPSFEEEETSKKIPAEFPIGVSLTPEGGDASRLYELKAEALDAAGGVLATATLISGYQANKVLYAQLVISERCRTESCVEEIAPEKLPPLSAEVVSGEPVYMEGEGGGEVAAEPGPGGDSTGEAPGGDPGSDPGTDNTGEAPGGDPGSDGDGSDGDGSDGDGSDGDGSDGPAEPADCLGVAGGSAVEDPCGVCDGDGTSCVGCDDVVNSGLVLDACGVCGGSGQGCLGCDGVMDSGAALDACGVCGGPGAATWYYDADDDGVGVQSINVPACTQPGGYVSEYGDLEPDCVTNDSDACGVCGGDSSSCSGCDGVSDSGSCSCGGGQSDCGDYCANLDDDTGNCGICGETCEAHLGCNSGSCSCGGGQSDCGDYCANLESDVSNCGSCGKVCAEGQNCSAGGCRCEGGLVACGDTCVAEDNNNCGECAHVCPGDLQCESGVCDAPSVDDVDDDHCDAHRRGGHDYLVCNGQTDGSGGLFGGGFGSSDGGNRGHSEAREFCKARGLDLAIVDSEAENAWLKPLLEAGGSSSGLGGSSNSTRVYWIGARFVESEWRWPEAGGGDSGALLSEGFTDWDSGQPEGNGQDCAMLYVQRSFSSTTRNWHDAGCGDTGGWVCESY